MHGDGQGGAPPHGAAPGYGAPAQTTPEQTPPGHAPGQVAPGQVAPGQVAPGQVAPGAATVQGGYAAPPQPPYGAPPAGAPYGGPPAGAPYGGPAAGPPVPQTGAAAFAQAKGIAHAFVDFSFSNYLAPRVVKVLYALVMLAAVGVVLMGLYGGFNRAFLAYYTDVSAGLLTMLLAPLAGLAVLILGRMYCELIVIFFKIAEHLAAMRASLEKKN